MSVTCDMFSLCALVSSNNKTDCHDMTEILLKFVLNTITLPPVLCHSQRYIDIMTNIHQLWLEKKFNQLSHKQETIYVSFTANTQKNFLNEFIFYILTYGSVTQGHVQVSLIFFYLVNNILPCHNLPWCYVWPIYVAIIWYYNPCIMLSIVKDT